MSYTNIQTSVGNFTIDFDGIFYSMDHNIGQLVTKNPTTGATTGVFILDTPIIAVNSLQFDGHYFWSLEGQGLSGFRVRKWEAKNGIASVENEFSYISNNVDNYATYSMCVEAYKDTLGTVYNSSTFDITDGQNISPGDEIVVGPSDHPNNFGAYSFTWVDTKVGDTITVVPPLSAEFNPGSLVVFSKAFFIFNDAVPSKSEGSLYSFRTDTGNYLGHNSSNLFAGVRASTFFKNKVMFIKGGEIVWLNPTDQKIFKSQGMNEYITTSGTYQETFDLAGKSETVYRLNQEHLEYNDTFDRWDEHDWRPLYNYNESIVTPHVFQVALKVDPQILHRYHVTVTGTLESDIVVTVLDQFRTPVLSTLVVFSTTGGGGTIVPLSGNTDANGQVKAKYTASSTVGDIEIIATVG